MRPMVDAHKSDISQAVINSMVVSGKLPEGTRVYGVWQKMSDGTFMNVRNGEIVDATDVVRRGYERGVSV